MNDHKFKSYTYNVPGDIGAGNITAIRVEQTRHGFWYAEALDKHGRNLMGIKAYPDRKAALKAAHMWLTNYAVQ